MSLSIIKFAKYRKTKFSKKSYLGAKVQIKFDIHKKKEKYRKKSKKFAYISFFL